MQQYNICSMYRVPAMPYIGNNYSTKYINNVVVQQDSNSRTLKLHVGSYCYHSLSPVSVTIKLTVSTTCSNICMFRI